VIPEGLSAILRLALKPRALLKMAFDPRVLAAGWKALRPFSLVIAGSSCILGAVLAFHDGSRDWINAAAALLAGLCLQAGVNLINDFSERGLTEDAPGLAEPGIAEPGRQPAAGVGRDGTQWLIFCVGLVVMAAAAPIGVFIAWRTGWPIIILGLVGFVGGYFYTGEPFNYKRRGLGPLYVFFLMGVFMIAGTYYAVRGAFSWAAVLASIPLSTLVSLILLANELRDHERDRRLGIRTMTVRVGYRRAVGLFFALLVFAYGSAAILRAFAVVPHLKFIFFAVPFAVPPAALAFRAPGGRSRIIPLIMLHHFAFGALYALTFIFP
jgi:1,4-dihydroxy-2-naphthoate octaprenyltransferase